jgi:hypothetical protein
MQETRERDGSRGVEYFSSKGDAMERKAREAEARGAKVLRVKPVTAKEAGGRLDKGPKPYEPLTDAQIHTSDVREGQGLTAHHRRYYPIR